MRLLRFEVENFRSIGPTVKCNVEPEITVLAGKNESGKSNLLQALVAWNKGEFEETDAPADLASPSSITACFMVSRDELYSIAKETFELGQDEQLEGKLSSSEYELKLQRSSSDQIMNVAGLALDALEELQRVELQYWTDQASETVKRLKTTEAMLAHRKELETLKKDSQSLLSFFTDLLLSLSQLSDTDEALNKAKADLQEYKDIMEFYSQDFDFPTVLLDAAPQVVLFDSFDDILPDEASEADVTSNTIVQRFFSVAGVASTSIFSETVSQRRKTIVNRVSSEITGDFCGYYHQSEVQVRLDIDGDNIQFYVYDANLPTPFHPGQRSKGFQWFLSFYLTLKSTGANDNLVILIDEPGLYLHPKAQREVLQVLEELAKHNQVIFSTHSPYLIDTDRLNRIRLVERDTDGGNTKVSNKIHAHASKDTLTPIVTAIGYSFGEGLSVGHSINLVTEGISDAYYIRAFLKLYGSPLEDIGVIGAVGANQVPNVICILLGWGVKCIALFDNDREGRRNHAKVVGQLGLEDGIEALFVSSTREDAIEDLFSLDDFYEYVLQEPLPAETPKKNSQLAGERDKVILAKCFYDSVMNKSTLRLSTVTEGNVLRLFRDAGISLSLDAAVSAV